MQRDNFCQKSVIVWHVKSAKHAAGKKRIDSKEKREINIAEMLQAYDKKVHPSGETLTECICVHCVKVVTAYLKAGVPLNRLDCFREILEESAFRLTSCDNLHDYIP